MDVNNREDRARGAARVIVAGLMWAGVLSVGTVAEAQIEVTSARIGCLDIQTTSNLTGVVERACGDKLSCSYKAPTPTQYQALGVEAKTRAFCTQAMEIKYHCGDRREKRAFVPGDAWGHPAAELACAKPVAAACKKPTDTCFIAFGDQGTGDEHQYRVARAMTDWHRAHRTDFLIGLGDNFYDVAEVGGRPRTGLRRCDGPKTEKAFLEPYKGIDKTFYLTYGNHDMMFGADPEALLCFARKTPKIHMPHGWYTFTKGNVQFFAMNTGILVSQKYAARRNEQMRWLDQELARSEARWKVVYGHHPVFSYGSHGDSAKFNRKLLPVLAKYKVDLYVTGHDHDQQHIHVPQYPAMEFVVSGAAAKASDKDPTGPNTRFGTKDRGFAYFVVSGGRLTFQLVDEHGRVRYDFSRTKDPSWVYRSPVASASPPASAGATDPSGMRVTQAEYGRNCGLNLAKAHITPQVQRQCNGREDCDYQFTWEKWGGDPSPSPCKKQIDIRYACGAGAKRVTVLHQRTPQNVRLSCR